MKEELDFYWLVNMSRVIYSLYIDIPDKELDLFDKNILRPQGLPTNYYNKKQFYFFRRK